MLPCCWMGGTWVGWRLQECQRSPAMDVVVVAAVTNQAIIPPPSDITHTTRHAPPQDATIEMHELGRVINGNVHESQILQAHLRTKGISSTDFVRDCLKQLFDKKFSCSLPGYASLGRKSALCKGCLRRVVPELAYQYRAQIARSELPASVTSRGDCWWGKECRTQAHNLTHAQRLNHVCDKSR
eukprot:m.256499 g.256499  ORF g.256499 m.256499 type:complete len:184 (-) comp19172_c2_seq4:100-651(-)